MTAEIDRARLVGIAERIKRSARHPDVIALCDGVIALAAERNAAPVSIAPANAVSSPANKPKTDRKALANRSDSLGSNQLVAKGAL
jgi:hypothetical protein